MKELMRKAHKMTKEIKAEYPEINYRTQLGLCMSYLLQKGVNRMKGSEKQVKYANDIIKNYESELENFKRKFGRFLKAQEDIKRGERFLRNVKNCDAAKVIETKNINFNNIIRNKLDDYELSIVKEFI